jgi:hypothetical protein
MAKGTELAVGKQIVVIVPDENPKVRDAYDAKQHQNGR